MLKDFRDIPRKDRVIVALDCDLERACELADMLQGKAKWMKVGMTLYYEHGPAAVAAMKERGFSVFLDLKLHDIPHQARGAAESCAKVGADMMTMHASGGKAMMEAAMEGSAAGAESCGNEAPAVIAVTVLTSTDDEMLHRIGVERPMEEQVQSLALLAKEAGATGVVASPKEARMLRAALGDDALIVCPGVRPKGSSTDDQSRVATPADAFEAGASHIVVGRPITGAEDPAMAFDEIAASL